MDGTVNASVFPHPDQVPDQARLAGAIEQREYRCDGILRRWEGPLQDVESPVCLHNGGRLHRL
jgi:glyceraldehyde-3-phosphate dehydrogenase (NADP+)